MVLIPPGGYDGSEDSPDQLAMYELLNKYQELNEAFENGISDGGRLRIENQLLRDRIGEGDEFDEEEIR